MSLDKQELTGEYNAPTELPKKGDIAEDWQEANQSWWEANPMRYDWHEDVQYEEFSKDFFLEIDRRFFSKVEEAKPCKRIPFDWLVDFESLRDKSVLEIGVGNGSCAQLLAEYSGSYSGIDITDYAVKSTKKRMAHIGTDANIQRMDAEKMDFEDESFDLIWTWGVIHHSSNTENVLNEMYRVLKPGGQAIVMVYYRGFWNYYVMAGLFSGVLTGEIFRTGSLHKSIQKNTDGAIARYYSLKDWHEFVSKRFLVKEMQVVGDKTALVPLPGGKVKEFVMSCLPLKLSRFFTNRLKMAPHLVTTLIKK